MYRIDYSKRAQRQIRKMDKQVQRLLFAWIDKHLDGTENPRQHGKGLIDNRANEWGYRIGDYRLIYDIQEDKLVILALEFGYRKDVY
ncbi:type II toxin-antitoxin system RelE family toxin [Streptococcus suis]